MPLLKLVKSKVDFAKKTEEYYNAILFAQIFNFLVLRLK